MNAISGIESMLYDPNRVNRMSSNIIKSKDTDGDKALSMSELGVFADVFNKMDVNQDDKVNRDELNAAFYANKINLMTTNLLMSKDSDGDNELSQSELNISTDIFAKVDANRDGKLDKYELNAAHPVNNYYSKALEALKLNSSQDTGSMISALA